MYQGIKDIRELCYRVEEMTKTKQDFIVNTGRLDMIYDDKVYLHAENGRKDYTFSINDLTHQQIAGRLKIPYKYYMKMFNENPVLLTENVNTWFRQFPENRMIRTFNNRARAFLSNKYMRRDNHDLLRMALPELKEVPGLKVASCNLNDEKLYIKTTTDRLKADVIPGDTVQAGIVISNSEVGLGSFRVEPLIFRLVCENGMIAADWGMKKYHVGRRISHDEEQIAAYTEETLKADDQAFWLKARDILRAALKEETFREIVDHLSLTTENRIEIKPKETVERMTRIYQLKEEEADDLLTELLSAGDINQYGLINATTVASKQAVTYERATDLERLAGQIMSMDQKKWREIAA